MIMAANFGNIWRRQHRTDPGDCHRNPKKSAREAVQVLESEPLLHDKTSTPSAPHLTAFFEQRLPIERGASENTRDSYAYAFRLLLTFVQQAVQAGTLPVGSGADRCPAGARLPEQSGNHPGQRTQLAKRTIGCH